MVEDRVKELGLKNKEEPRKMKDSGVEWIGEIPEEWETCKVKNVYSNPKEIVGNRVDLFERLALTLKGVLKRPKEDAEGLQPERFEGYQILRENQLVFKLIDLENVRTSRVGLSPYTGLVSPAYIVLDNSMTSKFGYYFFLSMWHREIFNQLGGDGVRSSIGPKDLLNLPYLLIDNEEQQAIANYLDSKVSLIDDIIEKTKQSIEDYKKYKQSLITETVTKGLNPDVEMKNSGVEWIGEVPKHWGVTTISRIFTFVGGYAYKSDNFISESNNQVIRLGNVKNDHLITDEKQVYIDNFYAMESQKALIEKDDILFTMTGTKGKRDYFYTLLVKDAHLLGNKLFLNQRVGCFRRKGNISMAYYNYLLKDNKILDSIFIYETGTANQGNLGIESIKKTKVHFPPLYEQQQIAEYLDTKCSQIDRIIDQKKTLINELETYKKSLIYECVTGKRYVG